MIIDNLKLKIGNEVGREGVSGGTSKSLQLH
jgi:hypothetical protein